MVGIELKIGEDVIRVPLTSEFDVSRVITIFTEKIATKEACITFRGTDFRNMDSDSRSETVMTWFDKILIKDEPFSVTIKEIENETPPISSKPWSMPVLTEDDQDELAMQKYHSLKKILIERGILEDE